MKKPLIGLTANQDTPKSPLSVNPAYMNAVADAGGIPLLLPYHLSNEDLEQLLSTLDGLLFTGGSDIHPFFIGEETHKNCGNVSLDRDRMEILAAQMACDKNMPVFGICRGAQIINAALGGTIYQDLPSQYSSPHPYPIAHRQPFSSAIPAHRVRVERGSLLEAITGQETLEVNSLHHQAIRKAAPGLKVCAAAPDGVIEAVWAPEKVFLLGVQWHPEHLYKKQADAQALFKAFTAACL